MLLSTGTLLVMLATVFVARRRLAARALPPE